MEDGGSPLIGLIVFVILLVLDAVLYGFAIAVDNANESRIDKKAEEGSRRAVWLKETMHYPYRVFHIMQILMTFISVTAGIYLGRLYGGLLAGSILSPGYEGWLKGLCYILAAFAVGFLLVALGIITPQKIAVRKADTWALNLSGFIRALTMILTPIGMLAELLSNLVVRIFGMDPHASLDDVTEEEIISMVNEGHEQGVLEANEAEMIHNIFEFADKEAKDIMTRRKHVVSVDGECTLSEALECMLEKNNSRFPVYREDMDNIMGVVHIKDAMIRSRDASYADMPLLQVPGLVREVGFIPETRNINVLFQTMQSQKNHMAIVVDEYGQTSGIVTMEDILEEIVGNILDEYDVEDAFIIKQSDGGYLMKGMAPLEDVCQALSVNYEEIKDYDTLNGYLISLIDKIPGDHEQFELEAKGYRFHVLSVENKMVQTVRVTALLEDQKINSAGQEQDAAI